MEVIKNEKIIRITSMLVAILIMFCSCSTTNNKLIINSKNVTKITINYRSVKDNNLKTTENKDEILSIINYINSLKLKKSLRVKQELSDHRLI